MTNKNPTLGMAGKYQFEAFRVDSEGNEVAGSRRVVLPWFDNLITDGGLDLLGTSVSDNLAYCRLGTGNTAPSNADNSLVAHEAASNSVGAADVSGLSVDSTYIYRRVTRRFAAGSADGVNLAEVGMASTPTGTGLFSRALLADSEGAPTTINLEADEVLDVVYELRLYLPAQDITVAAEIDGVSTTVTLRHLTSATWLNGGAARLGFNMVPSIVTNHATPAFAELPSATSGSLPYNSAPVTAVRAYQGTGTYSMHIEVQLGLTEGNVAGGVGAVAYAPFSATSNTERSPVHFLLGFNPKLNKTSSRTAKVKYSVSWGRYSP